MQHECHIMSHNFAHAWQAQAHATLHMTTGHMHCRLWTQMRVTWRASKASAGQRQMRPRKV